VKCDSCSGPMGWGNMQIRRHPDNPTKYTTWHIHYCAPCAYVHDYREIARLTVGDPA